MTWSQSSTCCGYGMFTAQAVSKASNEYGLFDVPCQWAAMPVVAEWGYEFHNNEQGIFPLCGNLTMAHYEYPPANRTEAQRRLALYWACRAADARATVNASSSTPIFSMTGHYLYSGLGAAFEGGKVIPGSEIGENINSINAHLAFTRGAARQWGMPFIIDFSAWMQGYILDYSKSKFWGTASSPTGGHSLMLFRRAYFASFFAGTNGLLAEAGAVNFFYENTTQSGVLQLSPLGAIGRELYALSHAAGGSEAVRGIPYVPLAIVIEQAHGMGLGWWYQQQAWDIFPLSENEQRTTEWLKQLWPHSFLVMNEFDSPISESNYMVASPFGDIADVLLPQNLSGAMLSEAYRVVVLGGIGTAVDSVLAAELQKYVQLGGVVVLGADEAKSLSPQFLGLTLGASNAAEVVSVVDLQTGWEASSTGVKAFCVSADQAYYIKTGGDPTKLQGWDGGTLDKCCSSDAANCLWFKTLADCQARLPMPCRACQATERDVACPAWTNHSTPLELTSASLSTAQPLMRMTFENQSQATSATVNQYGKGRVVVLLAPGSFANGGASLGITSHLLSRFSQETSPVTLKSNVSSDTWGGVEVQMNRLPTQWVVTLVNNHGIVKQANSPPSINWHEGRRVNVALQGGMGTLVAAWQRDGGGDQTPLPIEGQTVTVDIEAGGLRILNLEIK